MTDDRAIVVVNYRSSDLLEAHLTAPAQESGVPVVVVDNWSTPGERADVRELAARRGWRLVEADNRGFGAGVNLGVAAARAHGAEVVLLVNPDLRLTGSGVTALLAAGRDAAVAPRVDRPDGSPWFSGGSLDLDTGVARGRGGTDWLSGACLALPVEAWSAVGGLSEEYFMYWEDVDLSYRLRRAGWQLRVLDGVPAVHDAGGSQEHAGTRRKSDLYYRYNCRGRLVFAARNLDRHRRLRWALGSPGFARAVVLRGGRRQLLRSPRPVLAAAHGTVEGLTYLCRRGGAR